MTPQELKNSILQLAIQGKLVEQRPEEGTAEELYQQIQAEKQALIEAGRIKKEKPLPEIAEDEKPFDIPDSWKWVRLNEIASSGLGKTLNKTTDKGDMCQYLCSINVYWEGINLDKIKEACFTDDDKSKYKLEKGDLLICEGGDAGRCAIWKDDRTMYYQNALHRVRFYRNISVEFFRSIFELYKVNGIIKQHCKGETIQHLVQSELYSIPFPLPPIAEQKRIVAKIEELLPLVDRYEEAWTKLEEFNKRFPGDMQKSLLQMAIQGKLVEQHTEEGTGEELYTQIQAEKQALIKSGKIKKDKPLPEITDDEKPFDIPESWKWVRLGDLTELITKGSSPKWQGINYVDNGLLFVTSENVGKNELIWDNKKFVDKKFDEISPRSSLQYGDLLTNIVGASIGRTAVYNLHENANINQAVCLVRLINKDLLAYLLSYMNSYTAFSVMMNDKVESARANISLTNIAEFLVPLPPLAEQKRIVAKLEELLPLCERLK